MTYVWEASSEPPSFRRLHYLVQIGRSTYRRCRFGKLRRSQQNEREGTCSRCLHRHFPLSAFVLSPTTASINFACLQRCVHSLPLANGSSRECSAVNRKTLSDTAAPVRLPSPGTGTCLLSVTHQTVLTNGAEANETTISPLGGLPGASPPEKLTVMDRTLAVAPMVSKEVDDLIPDEGECSSNLGYHTR